MKKNKPSVLIVDDDAVMRFILKGILRDADYEIAGEASSGEAALVACRQFCPDVVLLDIEMPGMNGMEVLHDIRKGFPTIKVIMISASVTQDRVQDAVASGAAGFIVKPFKAGRVLDDIKVALAKHG